MREIEFRGKCISPKYEDEHLYLKTITGSLLTKYDDYFIYYNGEWYEVDKDSISQYAGMNDKNKNKIFENDKVKFKNVYGEAVGIVKYYSNCKPIIETESKKAIDIAECNTEDLEILKV